MIKTLKKGLKTDHKDNWYYHIRIVLMRIPNSEAIKVKVKQHQELPHNEYYNNETATQKQQSLETVV